MIILFKQQFSSLLYKRFYSVDTNLSGKDVTKLASPFIKDIKINVKSRTKNKPVIKIFVQYIEISSYRFFKNKMNDNIDIFSHYCVYIKLRFIDNTFLMAGSEFYYNSTNDLDYEMLAS